jgi:hypothetical protein
MNHADQYREARAWRWTGGLGLSGLMLLASGCTLGPTPTGFRPDPASIQKIGFQIQPDPAGQRLDAARLKDMAEKVASNLRTWGYPIESAQSGSGAGYSHIMEAKIDTARHQGTPVGFSMSMGNSDPRSLEFQKADVLPVDCVLHPASKPKDRASMYMDFMVKDADGPATYVDHMATVCFNLLEDLKIRRSKPEPTAAAETPTNSDTWFPEVRVEVRNKSTAPVTAAPVAPAAPAVTTTRPAAPRPTSAPAPSAGTAPAAKPAAPVQPADAPEAESAAPAAETAQPATPPPVSTENAVDPENGKKEIIIHNQGSPIILEFGYERK